MDTLNGDAAQRKVVGELPVGDGKRREIVTQPAGKNSHDGRLPV
jgi:hypothetical protein